MKSTLLLRLCGPMQSWGTQSRFMYRDTGREPSKSGVIGLVCAALGKPRVEVAGDGQPTLAQLAGLRMGVRVDREGSLECDDQTAENVAEAHGKGHRTVQSWRSYLADADFLVGLEGDRGLLERVDRALASPVWHLFLGRKSFVAAVPVRLPDQPPWGPGLSDQALEMALRSIPWHGRPGEQPPSQLRFVGEDTSGANVEVRNDVPRSFGVRAFAPRNVATQFLDFKEVARPCGSLG
jgi:CRISPR system Cascade subunit CasD